MTHENDVMLDRGAMRFGSVCSGIKAASVHGSDHGNIRALQAHGLAGVRFSQQALQRNA